MFQESAEMSCVWNVVALNNDWDSLSMSFEELMKYYVRGDNVSAKPQCVVKLTESQEKALEDAYNSYLEAVYRNSNYATKSEATELDLKLKTKKMANKLPLICKYLSHDIGMSSICNFSCSHR